jgi:YfiH family protein
MTSTWTLVKGVRAMWTTRTGGVAGGFACGVSAPPYDRLNLGDHVGDDPAHVQANRALVQAQLDGARAVFMKQVHGTDVIALSSQTPEGCVGDAAVTAEIGVACTMMVADCLPVLLCDAQAQAVAAAHAGWRGLVGGVLENTVQAVCQQAACSPSDVHAWLGPCIGPQAFEVGQEVEAAFVHAYQADASHFAQHAEPHKRWADLAALARARLHRLGVTQLSGNDSSTSWCTVSQPSDFFSFRRDGVTGRMAALIWREG